MNFSNILFLSLRLIFWSLLSSGMWLRFTGWLVPAWWSHFHGSKCRMFCIRYFDPCRWEHHAGSKRRSPSTHWRGEISQKNGNLNSTAAKTKDSFLLCLPWYCLVSSVFCEHRVVIRYCRLWIGWDLCRTWDTGKAGTKLRNWNEW
jgi:hypothetical protein